MTLTFFRKGIFIGKDEEEWREENQEIVKRFAKTPGDVVNLKMGFILIWHTAD